MGDVYASLFGTIVIRHRSVPARPAELDGEVVILVEKGGGLDGAGAEAELRSALGAFENPRYEEGRWRVRFHDHRVRHLMHLLEVPRFFFSLKVSVVYRSLKNVQE